MKQIELTEKHKSKLLEMCKKLFPEYSNTKFGYGNIEWSEDFIILGSTKENPFKFVYFHWFEFCINILCPQLTNRTAMFNDIEDDNIKLSIHPVDYLYEEFKKFKITREI